MSDFGVYVHWPFCAAKCPYCDFNSHVRERIDETDWVKLIAKQLRAIAVLQAEPSEVQSVFFGGGTPSLMSGSAVGAVLEAISNVWNIARDAEITLEANPNSAERRRFRDYRSAGVNRVSIGVQSLDDDALRQLGRLHDAREGRDAVAAAVEIFPRSSLDLIYARPGQSLTAWRDELHAALAFGTGHLSLYQLTIEQGTAFASLHRQGKLVLPDEEQCSEFYELTQEICGHSDLPAYEVSNHAKSGQESRHNLVYWRYGDYAGVGPGAHSRLTIDGRRWGAESERLPERWAARIHGGGSGLSPFEISPADAAREHLLMNLRIKEGVDLSAFAARWSLLPEPEHITTLADIGLVTVTQGRLAVTARGRMVLNSVTEKLADALRPA